MGVSSLPKTVTQQHRGCDLNPGPSVPESSTLTTRLPSHPMSGILPDFLRHHKLSLFYLAPSPLYQHFFNCSFHLYNTETLSILNLSSFSYTLKLQFCQAKEQQKQQPTSLMTRSSWIMPISGRVVLRNSTINSKPMHCFISSLWLPSNTNAIFSTTSLPWRNKRSDRHNTTAAGKLNSVYTV